MTIPPERRPICRIDAANIGQSISVPFLHGGGLWPSLQKSSEVIVARCAAIPLFEVNKAASQPVGGKEEQMVLCKSNRFGCGDGWWVIVIAFVLAAASGCGRDEVEPESTVTGAITFQGKPIPGGTVTFEVTTDSGTRPCMGEINDGRYEVTNASPGRARIGVETATQEGLPNYMPLPRQLADPAKSGLEYEIRKGEQQHDIVIK